MVWLSVWEELILAERLDDAVLVEIGDAEPVEAEDAMLVEVEVAVPFEINDFVGGKGGDSVAIGWCCFLPPGPLPEGIGGTLELERDFVKPDPVLVGGGIPLPIVPFPEGTIGSPELRPREEGEYMPLEVWLPP